MGSRWDGDSYSHWVIDFFMSCLFFLHFSRDGVVSIVVERLISPAINAHIFSIIIDPLNCGNVIVCLSNKIASQHSAS
jgi:hypothetical protein